MLEQEDLDIFRTLLTQQREELMGKAANMVAELIQSSDKLTEPLDQATFESSRSEALRIRKRERQLIRKTVEALHRIEDGAFGICENCDEEIGIARLRARPIASHCVRCKTKMENREKLYPTPQMTLE